MGGSRKYCLGNIFRIAIYFTLTQRCMGDVLTQSFFIRLAEMQEILTNQKEVINVQKNVTENLAKLVEEQRKVLKEKSLLGELQCQSTTTGRKLVCGSKVFNIRGLPNKFSA